jgi:hypothetical protein
VYLSYDPAIPLVGILPKRNEKVCPNKNFAHKCSCNIIQNSQTVETTQIPSIGKW